MYASFFNLSYLPFELSPDTRQYTSIPQYNDALDSLKYCVSEGQGFLKVSGGIGLGKTLLCRLLISSLSDDYYIIYLPSPPKSPTGVCRVVAKELNITLTEPFDDDSCVHEIYLSLLERKKQGKRVVILVDEAQAMDAKSLEALRLIANLDTHCGRLLQVLLFGSSELDTLLAKPELAALRQRIVLDINLRELTEPEAQAYILGRLLNAGGRDTQVFEGKATKLLVSAAKGNPRVINVLANLSMMSAFSRNSRQVHLSDVHRALNEARLQVSHGNRLGAKLHRLLHSPAVLIATAILTACLLIAGNKFGYL